MIKMYESSKLYVIGYDTANQDFKKICTLYKDEVDEDEAEDILCYFQTCE